VLVSSAGSAAVLIGIIQTPGVSHLIGCTPLGPVGWAIAGTATTVALLGQRVLGRREEQG